MSSSLGVARRELFLLGHSHPVGSLAETLAISAHRHREQVRFRRTMVLVNAIIHTGKMVAQAAAGSGSSSDGDELQKSINGLKELMFPELAEDREEKAREAKKLIEEEMNKGPMKARPSGRQNRVRRSRRK